MKSNQIKGVVTWNVRPRVTVEVYTHDQPFKDDDGSWAWYSYGPYEDGEGERYHGGFKTRREAREARREILMGV